MSSIAEGLKIKGEVQGSEDLRVDGEVEGRINLPGAVVILGPKGRVTGDVQAREVVLEGACRGNVTARERVRIAATGKLEGDVAAERLVIEEGAQVSGRVESGPAQAQQRAVARPPVAGTTAAAAPAHTPRPDSQV